MAYPVDVVKNPKQVFRALKANVGVLRYLTTTYSDSMHGINPAAQQILTKDQIDALGKLINLAIDAECILEAIDTR